MSKTKSFFNLYILLLLLSTLVSISHADPQYMGAPIEWKWTMQNWGGNDKPYLVDRESIGELYKQKKLNDATLAQYKKASFAKKNDSLLRFKWAYYAYCYALLQPDISEGSGKLAGVEQAFRFEKSPGSYQYTRLRFLVLSYLTQSGPELKQLGERLLKRDPKDVSVKYVEVTHLRNGDAKDQQRALQYAEQLIALNPKEGAYYALLGATHTMLLYSENPHASAKSAIANYQRYISLSKPTGRELARVEETIKKLQSRL